MVQFITNLFHNSWELTAEMAPYLLFGFAVAGLLHVLIRADFVQRHLGKPGLSAVIKGSLVGVPMPLCSCSVIPIAASLRKSGASRGATASFLSSTPQTGVDSIFATYALLGGIFTAVRVLVAFACGITAGYLIEIFCKETPKADSPNFSDLNFSPEKDDKPTSTPATDASCCGKKSPQRGWREAIRYGFITLPADLALALIFGLILAGLITTLLPQDLLTGSLSSGFMAFFMATLISLPLYVCATGSIPMAYALMAAGLSPGAALVFLITGPATNTATIVTVWKMLGRIPTIIYLLSLLAISWLAGALFNMTVAQHMIDLEGAHGEHAHLSYWQHLAGILLVGILLASLIVPKLKQGKSCCSE
ncbi:hypothetical protein DDZ13_04050 [Coraliomargarita sinensis]|uniref:Permease n=1 Tax=Coraliomargarita sinensis TaxID=2174842 RepID=A0A317ZP60_9BACT|nr:SO_0444 family Cu/Zn efflux transporter [Coraliomargarita sinensis]PXA05141.1 hypothetical protein DDZ13_04050 [Coraliomargarita sinensis]